jgi:RNA polymerase sigma-70 factor (ECF subfamily)
VSEGKQSGADWSELALSHLDALYGFAMVLTRNSVEAEDLLQETYTRAVPQFSRLRADSNVKAWLFTVMRNQWLKERRHLSCGPDFVALDDVEARQKAIDANDPQTLYIRIWQREEIRAGLEQLPRHCAEIIVLSDMEGFSYKEIAEILECPIGTVMSRLARARAKLKRVLRIRLAGSAEQRSSG